MVIKALNLENKSILNADKQHDVEALVRKYAHIFMLPGAPFHGVTSEHTIDTSDISPQYENRNTEHANTNNSRSFLVTTGCSLPGKGQKMVYLFHQDEFVIIVV